MLSKVPDHPALGLLSVTPQDSPTTSTQETQSMADGNRPVNNDNLTSTFAASTSNEGNQSKKGSSTTKDLKRKRKTGSDKQLEAVSYEVEEINGHRQDNQARN